MLELFYPCTFLMNDFIESDDLLLYVSYYRFRSTKSNLFYLVRVESYKSHVYGVKFFLKNMQNSPRKYCHLTNTYEPRVIVYSIFQLMFQILQKDPLATFLFIGNPDEGQNSYYNTRRYRLYCKLVENKISDRYFKHIRTDRYSLYILANKRQIEYDPFFAKQLVDEFLQRFVLEE